MHILLVDDHSLIRSGIRDSLSNHYGAVTIAEAESSRTALSLLKDRHFDLALIDLFIPGEKLFRVVSECCAIEPELPVIVLSSSEQTSHIRRCIDLGAVGFVSKSSSQGMLFEAIDIVLAGGTCFPRARAGVRWERHPTGLDGTRPVQPGLRRGQCHADPAPTGDSIADVPGSGQ